MHCMPLICCSCAVLMAAHVHMMPGCQCASPLSTTPVLCPVASEGCSHISGVSCRWGPLGWAVAALIVASSLGAQFGGSGTEKAPKKPKSA
jgi:hypothetical protein